MYLILPFDLIPDGWVPGLGYADDGIVLLKALRNLLADTDRELALQHWQGGPRDLDRIRNALTRWDDTVSGGISRLIAKLFGETPSVRKSTVGASQET